MGAPRIPARAEGAPPLGVRDRFVALAAILLAAALVFALGESAGSGGGAIGALPSGTPLSPQTCSQLQSPATLSKSLADLYTGFSLANASLGPNGTPALGISSYPTLAAGQVALISAWNSICQSGQFGYAYVQANGSAGFFTEGGLASDGHYVFSYGFDWFGTCPGTISNSTPPCQATATWSVDLVTDVVSGPFWSNALETPLGVV